MIIHENLEQGSDEWFNIRKGKMTASHAQEIGNNGKGLDTYIRKMMAEKYSNGRKEQFSNKDTERGNELEEQAASIYAFNAGADVKKIGFIELSEYAGCSPDRLVGDDGGLEIKCPNDEVYFNYLLDGVDAIDTKYVWQIQMCLMITGRKWWDFMAYNPNFPESSFIHRFFPDPEKIKKIQVGLVMGEEKIKSINKKLSK